MDMRVLGSKIGSISLVWIWDDGEEIVSKTPRFLDGTTAWMVVSLNNLGNEERTGRCAGIWVWKVD